jgi:Tfp pilus assembly protein PilF
MTSPQRVSSRARDLVAAVAAVAAIAGVPASAQQPAAAPPAPAASFMASLAQATASLGAGDHEAARTHLYVTLRHAPEYPNVLFHLARVEALLGNADAAPDVLERLAVSGICPVEVQ